MSITAIQLVLAQATPAAATRVHAWADRWLPDFLQLRILGLALWQWGALVVLGLLAFLFGYVAERITLSAGKRVARLTRFQWDDQVLSAARGPLRLLVAAVLFAVGSRVIALTGTAQAAADILARSLGILSVAWFAIRAIRFFARWVHQRVEEESPENIARVRGMKTQVTVLRHVAEVAVVVIAAALVLMQFEVVRSVGVSLLASAGIAGLVLGLAAQKSISSILAGIQLSITQPIRIGDAVIVQNEFGWIEEITLTYVVVKVWDLRRLIVPISHFLEQPFQNWNKVSPELLGTVEIRADYTCDVDAVRAELDRILENEGRSLFDGRARGVQVTDCTERIMTLRVLVSARNSGDLWNLRCIVREKLIAFLTRNPMWLPVNRNETRVQSADGLTPPMAPFTPPPKGQTRA